MMRRVPRRRSAKWSLSRALRPLLSVAVLALGLLLSGAFVGVAVRQNAIDSEARTLQREIEQETARNAQLQADIAQRRTDQHVIDKARELGYVRPGEGLVAIERGPGGEPVVRINPTDGGRLARWIALFFGPR
jgi:cell division protein FtsB